MKIQFVFLVMALYVKYKGLTAQENTRNCKTNWKATAINKVKHNEDLNQGISIERKEKG